MGRRRYVLYPTLNAVLVPQFDLVTGSHMNMECVGRLTGGGGLSYILVVLNIYAYRAPNLFNRSSSCILRRRLPQYLFRLITDQNAISRLSHRKVAEHPNSCTSW